VENGEWGGGDLKRKEERSTTGIFGKEKGVEKMGGDEA